ncbi:MAG TPA: hypothetical protein VMG31_04560 [Verrucomicrobiae bacterium]|nr:hypothetical protein [Verrucomicrobiae bacterium]
MKIKAWGWLIAGVAALGLNGFYQDGGMSWAHRIADRIESRTETIVALASGKTGQFVSEAELVTSPDETASCRMATALAEAQTRIARSATGLARVEQLSAREEAQVARIEARRAQIEAEVASRRVCIRVPSVSVRPAVLTEVQVPQINIPKIQVPEVTVPEISIPRISVPEISVPKINIPACPRVRVNLPRMPRIQMPAMPVVHIDASDAGPV